MTDVVVGAVAYDARVVPIWTGFRHWLRDCGLDVDFVLYSNYERQVEDLVAGRIDAAWNSPLAWVRARRLAAADGAAVNALTMRDTDRDLTSVIVARSADGFRDLGELKGSTLATGPVDSPQGTLLPVAVLRSAGLDPETDVSLLRHDLGVGLHGDDAGGERQALRSLLEGRADAACLSDTVFLAAPNEGLVSAGELQVLGRTEPYDHCNLTVLEGQWSGIDELRRLLLSMDYGDDGLRPLMELEGMTRWVPGRTTGYAALEAEVEASGFYGLDGSVTSGYRP